MAVLACLRSPCPAQLYPPLPFLPRMHDLLACLSACLRACLSACLLSCVLACVLACLSVCSPGGLPAHLPDYPLAACPANPFS